MKKQFLVNVLFVVCILNSNLLYAEKKPTLGVVEFKNQTSAGWWRTSVGWELSGMLTNELASTGDFRLVERNKLESVLAEQNLGASGRVNDSTAAKIGNLTGAQFLVMGTVTSFEENTSKKGGGLSFRGLSLGGKKSEAYIAIDVRVVDSTTGEIAFVRTIEGRSKSSGMRVGVHRGGFGGALASEKKTPTGKAIRAALMEITDYLACEMVYKDECRDEYRAKEKKRRRSTKGALDLD